MKGCRSCGELVKGGGCHCPHCGQSLCSTSPSSVLLMGLVLSGCVIDKPVPAYGIADTSDSAFDRDGDGYDARLDCDDDNPEVHPDATEKAGDGVDSNCDGSDDT